MYWFKRVRDLETVIIYTYKVKNNNNNNTTQKACKYIKNIILCIK